VKGQQAFRLTVELVDRLKESANRNFRSLTQEVEMRLRQSLEQNPGGASTPQGTGSPDKEVHQDDNTPTDA